MLENVSNSLIMDRSEHQSATNLSPSHPPGGEDGPPGIAQRYGSNETVIGEWVPSTALQGRVRPPAESIEHATPFTESSQVP